MGDSVGAIFTGTSAVGALGPQQPTAGLFGTGGQFSSAQTFQTTSAISTGIGAFSSIAAGKAVGSSFDVQAGSQEIQAEAVKLNATEQANFLKRQLLRDIGSSTASAAARGIDVGSGSPVDVVERDIGFAQRQAAKLKAGGQISSLDRTIGASESRARGAGVRATSNLKAAQGLASFGLSRVI